MSTGARGLVTTTVLVGIVDDAVCIITKYSSNNRKKELNHARGRNLMGTVII